MHFRNRIFDYNYKSFFVPLDMERLKAHYEEKISALNVEASKLPQNDEVINKIRALKSSLVGGECANNTQLQEKRRRKKLAAEHRTKVISEAIGTVEQAEARDILQAHYTDIQQELKMKTDALKAISRKVTDLINRNILQITFIFFMYFEFCANVLFFLISRLMHWNVR